MRPLELVTLSLVGLTAFACPQVMTWLVTGSWPYWLQW